MHGDHFLKPGGKMFPGRWQLCSSEASSLPFKQAAAGPEGLGCSYRGA